MPRELNGEFDKEQDVFALMDAYVDQLEKLRKETAAKAKQDEIKDLKARLAELTK